VSYEDPAVFISMHSFHCVTSGTIYSSKCEKRVWISRNTISFQKW